MFASISNRVNTFLLALLLLMAATIIGILASRAGAGPLDPPGTPASTLPQVEPRMPIPPVGWDGTFPITISQPGSYFFTQDITGVSTEAGIDVRANHVTIDLNGFALLGVAGSSHGITDCGSDQIGCGDQPEDLNVRNGTISGWAMVGIESEMTEGGAFEDLALSHNAGGGIRAGGVALVTNVTAYANGQNGIYLDSVDPGQTGGIVRDSTAYNNASDGIVVRGQALVSNNDSYSNGAAGIRVANSNNRVDSNNVANNLGGGIIAAAASTANVVVRNSARFNTGGNYIDLTASNDFGPTAVASSATSPWANISH